MIVGKTFVWLHFPKCAGHTVEQALRSALRRRRDVEFDQDPSGWHDSLEDRRRRVAGFDPGDRAVICGFRRLPFWILSRVHYEASRPPYHTVTRAMLRRGEFFHQNGQVGRADDYVSRYADSGVDRWIRTEHMAEDFERHFGDILGSQLARAAVRKVRRVVNGTRLNYVRSLEFYFTAEELEELYAANPLWAQAERRLYGDVLRLPSAGPSYRLDEQMRFVSASEVALDTWGKSAADVIGRGLLDVFPLARGSEPYEAQQLALKTRQAADLETVSPTLGAPVRLEIRPGPGGLDVRFELGRV